MAGSDAFLLCVSSGSPPEEAVAEAARAGGLDPHGLGLRLRADGLVVAAQGAPDRLAVAADALARGGARSAVIRAAEARALPGVQVAGGVAEEGSGGVLRVHGRPAGPPAGEPILLVLGDLGREEASEAASPRPGDVLKQRVLRAVFPVVDVVWSAGRARIPMRAISYRGLSSPGFSLPDNFLRLLQLLVERAGGAVLDVGFVGQDVPIEPLRGAQEPLEGADRDRLARFERYSAAAALAFARGLYPGSQPGELRLLARGEAASAPPAAMLFASPLRTSGESPVPWIRRPAGKSRRSWTLRRALPFAPVLFFVAVRACLDRRPESEGTGAILAGAILAAAGIASIGFGLRSLRRRERLRAVPTSKVRSVAMGMAEVAGRVVATARFKAPYSKMPCVWYRFEVEERADRGDEQGAWQIVQRGGSGEVPFRVEDGTGSVLVQPAGARIEVEPVATALGPRRRVREWILSEGDFVYLSGYAHRRSAAEGVSGGADHDDVFFGAGTDGHLVISPRSHAQQERRLGSGAAFLLAAGILSLLFAILLFAS